MAQEKEKPVHLRLDIDITNSQARLQRLYLVAPPTVNTPVVNANTKSRWKASIGKNVICVTGTAAGARHVFAVVSDTDLSGGDPPVGVPWTRPLSSDNSYCFNHVNNQELPVFALNTVNHLTVWGDFGADGYAARHVPFTPFDAGETECVGGSGSGGMAPPPAALPVLGELARFAEMAEAWSFTLAGAANLKCPKCTVLNGTWTLAFDRDHPERCRWHTSLPVNLFSAKGQSVWRLQYHPADGYWYLDCLGNIDQGPGTWISYRRHESAWDVRGPNEMHLHGTSGMCEMPPTVLLLPG